MHVMQNMRKLLNKHARSDEGISPVIGTILMVAATVIIGGAVYAAVNAYSGKSAKPTTDVSFKAQTIDTNNDGVDDAVKLTYLAGPSTISPGVSLKDNTGAALVTASGAISTPGDFQLWKLSEAATNPPTAYTIFATVTVGSSTVLDQTLTMSK